MGVVLKIILAVILGLTDIDPGSRAFAQSLSSPLWVYTVLITSNNYQVVRVDVAGQTSPQIIYTIREVTAASLGEESTTTSGEVSTLTLHDLLPSEEIDFAKTYYQQHGLDSIDSLFVLHPQVNNVSMKISPDRQHVALNVNYTLCVHPGQLLCFGTSQLIMLQTETKQSTLLWNVGHHTKRYSSCVTAGTNPDSVETIGKMEWTGDGKAIIVSFAGDVYCCPQESCPSVFIVFIDSKNVIGAGSAVIWTVAKPDNELDAIVENTDTFGYSLNVGQIDTQKETILVNVFQFPHGVIPDLASAGKFVIRQGDLILFNAQSLEFEGGLTALSFRITRDSYFPFVSIPKAIQSVHEGDTSPDGTQSVVKTLNGQLWLLHNRKGVLTVQLLISESVSAWSWLDNATLLYRPEGQQNYVLIDKQGQTLKQLDLNRQIDTFTASQAIPIISIADFQ